MEFDSFLIKTRLLLQKIRDKNIVGLDATESLAELDLTSNENCRKFVFYLILNCDTGLAEDLADNQCIGLFVDLQHLLDLNWALKAIISLQLQKYLLEIITYGPSELTVVILKTLTSTQAKHFTYKLAVALFNKLFHYGGYGSKQLEDHFSSLANTLKLDAINALQKFENTLAGHYILEYVSLTHSCLTSASDDGDLHLFYNIDINCDSNPKKTDMRLMQRFVINNVFNNLCEMLESVTCDLWLSMAELTSNCDEASVQTLIGNRLFFIRQTLDSGDWEGTVDFKKILSCFEIKPITEQDTIHKSSIEEIIQVIENPVNNYSPSLWYNSLTCVNEAWHDSFSIRVFLTHLDLSVNCESILEKCLLFILNEENNTHDMDELAQLFLLKLNEKELKVKTKFFDSILNYYNNGRQSSSFCCDNENELIEIFNKISNKSDPLDVVSLLIVPFIQNPHGVIYKIVGLACAAKENQLLCIDLLRMFNRDYNFQSCHSSKIQLTLLEYTLGNVIESEMSEKMKNNLKKFLSELHSTSLLPQSFLTNCLLAPLKKGIEEEDWINSQFLVDLLSVCWKSSSIDIGVLAVYLARTLSNVMGNLLYIPTMQVILCESVVLLIRDVVKCESFENERSYLWARTTIRKLHYLVWTQFQPLCISPKNMTPQNPELHIKLLVCTRGYTYSFIQDESTNPRKLSAALFKLLPFLHLHELEKLDELCCNLLTQSGHESSFCEIFLELLVVHSQYSDDTHLVPFERCLNLFTFFLETYLNEDRMSMEKASRLFRLILRNLNNEYTQENRNKIYLLIAPVLVKILKNVRAHSENDMDLFLQCLHHDWRAFIAKRLGI